MEEEMEGGKGIGGMKGKRKGEKVDRETDRGRKSEKEGGRMWEERTRRERGG